MRQTLLVAVAGSLPAANLDATRTLASFEKDERLRRAWSSRSEREVLDRFGMPDAAGVGRGGSGTGHGQTPEGRERVLELHRGRLSGTQD